MKRTRHKACRQDRPNENAETLQTGNLSLYASGRVRDRQPPRRRGLTVTFNPCRMTSVIG
jgi:hypothetical protein